MSKNAKDQREALSIIGEEDQAASFLIEVIAIGLAKVDLVVTASLKGAMSRMVHASAKDASKHAKFDS